MFESNFSTHATQPLQTHAAAAVLSRARGAVTLRTGTSNDIGALEALERRAFSHDRISRHSFARLLKSPSASLIVADCDAALCGYALVLFRAQRRLVRLYSIAVDPAGRQFGSLLLQAAELTASRSGSTAMRLEVREDNAAANNLYRKSGYRTIAHLPAYYADGSNALRLEKQL